MKILFRSAGVAGLIATASLLPTAIAWAQAQPVEIEVAPEPSAPPSDSSAPAPQATSQAPDSAPQAQEDGPISVSPSPPPPAAATSPAPAASPTAAAAGGAAGGDSGTTIVGDQESPIGLFITPWKNEFAENGLDRPARFVDVDTAPIDPDVFKRRVEYYDVITAYRNAHLSSGK